MLKTKKALSRYLVMMVILLFLLLIAGFIIIKISRQSFDLVENIKDIFGF